MPILEAFIKNYAFQSSQSSLSLFLSLSGWRRILIAPSNRETELDIDNLDYQGSLCPEHVKAILSMLTKTADRP
jgi:hypothetical protein